MASILERSLSPVACDLRSRLNRLRSDKAALDRAIRSLEQYSNARGPNPDDQQHRMVEMEKTGHILLIEDTVSGARLVAEALKRLEYPHLLTRAESADRAMEMLEDGERFFRRNPDLILLDLHLPAGDGFEALATMKQIPRYRAIPIVVLTTSQDRAEIRRAYDLHANAVVGKGNNLDELTEALDAICRMWLKVAGRPNADLE